MSINGCYNEKLSLTSPEVIDNFPSVGVPLVLINLHVMHVTVRVRRVSIKDIVESNEKSRSI